MSRGKSMNASIAQCSESKFFCRTLFEDSDNEGGGFVGGLEDLSGEDDDEYVCVCVYLCIVRN